MESKHLRWASVGAAFALFAAIDLIVLLLMPESENRVFVPPLIAGVVVLFTLPSLLHRFERQQDRIERQRREILTHHTMHTAIVAEMELGSLLDVAARQATNALDGEQGGVVLIERGSPVMDAYFNVPDNERDEFRHLVFSGEWDEDDRWVVRLPLRRTGELLGHIAVSKRKPSAPFAPSDQALLTALAATVVVAIANARALEAARESERNAKALAQAERDLRRERKITQAFQEALLPEVPERTESLAFSRRYEAQSDEAQVGGDIYDLFPLTGGRWGIVIADVSGKGLAAARKTAMVKYSLRSYAREHESPADVLGRLNDALFEEPDMTGFVTLFYGVFSERDETFTYASAGHEPPLVRRNGGEFDMLAPTGLVLGAVQDQEYSEASTRLSPGEGLLLYTDGLTEARSPSGDFLEVEGLMHFLGEHRDCPPEAVADRLLDWVRTYTGGKLSDDAAIVWVERLPVSVLAAVR